MKKEFDFEGTNWVSKPISIGNSKVSFFIIYNEDMNETLDGRPQPCLEFIKRDPMVLLNQ